MSRSLGQLRRDVAAAIGEVMLARASSPTIAPASTFIDARVLLANTNEFADADILITTGACAGHLARVTSSSQDDAAVSFVPECASAISVGDRAELYGMRGHTTIDQLDEWIRRAQDDAFPNYRVPYYEELTDAYDYHTDATIEVPLGFSHVYAIRYPDVIGFGSITAGTRYSSEGWYPIPGRRIQIDGWSRTEAQGRLLTLYGYRKDQPLELDTDTTDLPSEWITFMVSGYFYGSLPRSQDQQTSMQKFARADALRGRIATPMAPNTRKVLD